jgi:hypothetical protein
MKVSRVILIFVFFTFLILIIQFFNDKKNTGSSLTSNPKPELIQINGKDVVGATTKEIDLKTIKFVNKENPKWQKELHQNLMRFAEDVYKEVVIYPEHSYVLYEDKVARYVENVRIKITKKDGKQSSYNAQVDSMTGEVLKTWNRTIHEPSDKQIIHDNSVYPLEDDHKH